MKFTSLTLLLIGGCIAALYYGQRLGVEKVSQRKSISTESLDNGSLSQVFQKLDDERTSDSIAKGTDELSVSDKLFFKLPANGSHSRSIRISEVQPSNAGEVVDEDGHCPDWIELWNPSASSFDLTGWFLTDDLDKPWKWRFPKMIVPAGHRFVVYASGRDVRDASQLETNFRLGQKDQYVALVEPDAQTIAQILTFEKTLAKHGVSYGLSDQVSLPMLFPTPGEKNAEPGTGIVEQVRFSISSRLFESPLLLELDSGTTGSTIRFTTDGTLPRLDSGTIYTQPLKINRTTIIRAIASAPQMIVSEAVTRSYLSIDDLIAQPKRPNGFPKFWNETKSDYEMDPRITSQYESGVRSAFASLPMVSVVADPEPLLGEDGIYSNTWERGFDWEIPASIEMLGFAGQPGFQSTVGIRVAGNESRKRAWKKHSLRINFRARYGQSELQAPVFDQPGKNRFSTLMLRSTDDSWVTHDRQVRDNAQFVRDQWARDTHRSMGRLSARGRFVHVCINGLYWGIYNLIERPDEEFLAHQLGGDAADYVVIRSRIRKLDTDADGEERWSTVCDLAQKDLEYQTHFDAICEYLDVESFIDYCLVLLYAGGEDWPLNRHNNMKSFCRRGELSPMQFLVWDADSAFASGWSNNSSDYVLDINSRNNPQSFESLFNSLSRNKEFRRLFEARLKYWSSEGRSLDDNRSRDRYKSLLDSVEPALIAESARWGDVQASSPYTPMGAWQDQKNRILNEWFTSRAERVLNRMHQYWVELDNRSDD